jgi:hypothetical protein
MKRSTSCQTARASPCRLGDDPATKQNANDENAASGEIEPSGPSSFRQHRSSIKRQKQQNSSRMAEWESWRDNSGTASASITPRKRGWREIANGFINSNVL